MNQAEGNRATVSTAIEQALPVSEFYAVLLKAGGDLAVQAFTTGTTDLLLTAKMRLGSWGEVVKMRRLLMQAPSKLGSDEDDTFLDYQQAAADFRRIIVGDYPEIPAQSLCLGLKGVFYYSALVLQSSESRNGQASIGEILAQLKKSRTPISKYHSSLVGGARSSNRRQPVV